MPDRLHPRTETERLSHREQMIGGSHVRRREQLPGQRPNFEGQSTKRRQVGEAIYSKPTGRSCTQPAQNCRGRGTGPLHGQEKNEVYVLTVVDRATRCVRSWAVVPARTSEAWPACVERAPQAKQYYRDAFPVYDTLY